MYKEMLGLNDVIYNIVMYNYCLLKEICLEQM